MAQASADNIRPPAALTRRLLAPSLPFVLAVSVASGARADDKAACLDAAAKAQRLRNAHQLVEARDQLRICAAAVCPTAVQSDCVTWIADVERALPEVVVTAKDASGNDIVDVTVTVDGQPFAKRLAGQAIPMNAGLHAFHFEANGLSLDQQVVVREGAKDQPIAVVLKPAVPTAATVPAAIPATAPSSTSSVRTVGWVLGGVGAVGLVVGVIGGIAAIGDKSSANCTGNVCQGSLGGLKTMADVADVGLIGGGVLLATGAGLVLFGPRAHAAATMGLRLVPVWTLGGGEAVVGGSF